MSVSSLRRPHLGEEALPVSGASRPIMLATLAVRFDSAAAEFAVVVAAGFEQGVLHSVIDGKADLGLANSAKIWNYPPDDPRDHQ